jgi:hypothetical protein
MFCEKIDHHSTFPSKSTPSSLVEPFPHRTDTFIFSKLKVEGFPSSEIELTEREAPEGFLRLLWLVRALSRVVSPILFPIPRCHRPLLAF